MIEPGSSPEPKPELSPADELFCLGCGARNDPRAVECWLCSGRSLVKAGPDGRPPEPPGPSGRFPSTIAGKTMLYVAFCAVVALFVRTPPGYLIVLAVTVLPAIALVEVKAARRRRRGMPMAWAGRFSFFLLYLILVPVLLIGAGLVALFIFCSVTGRPNFH